MPPQEIPLKLNGNGPQIAATKSKWVQKWQEKDDYAIFQPNGHPKQARIDGEIWPPIFKPELVRSAKKYKPRDSDVFVCTYPKCGTTWTQHICSQLMLDNYGPGIGKELCVTSPMIERMGTDYVENMSQPRLLKSHLQWTHIPKSNEAKYIFVCRNPKDCLVSYYFHHRNFKIYNFADGDFETFFELFMIGRLGFGDYFDHLLSWLPHIHRENVLFLKYEDMLLDLPAAVKAVGRFLGGMAGEYVTDKDTLFRVVQDSSLQSMVKDQWRWFPQVNLTRSFIRKGANRDWVNYLNKAQSDHMDQLFSDKMRGTVAETWWSNEMAWH